MERIINYLQLPLVRYFLILMLVLQTGCMKKKRSLSLLALIPYEAAEAIIPVTEPSSFFEPEIDIKQSSSISNGGSYDFGSIVVGSIVVGSFSSTITFTIENIGTSVLELSSLPSLSGSNTTDFTLNTTSTSSEIAAGSSTTFSLTFTPSTTGSFSATVTINSNDSDEDSYTINFTGTGTANPMPEIDLIQGTSISSGGSYDFGSVTNGSSSSTMTFTIENIGSATLTLSSVPTLSGINASEFSLNTTPTSTSIGNSSSTTFTITFSPTSVGSKTATVTIDSDDSDEGSYTINLTGTATAIPVPEINVKQASTSIAHNGSYDFGNITQATSSSTITFTIENIGTANLTLSGTPKILLGGSDAIDYSVDQTMTTGTVPASGNTTFTVTFTPLLTGTRSAILFIASNDADEPWYLINLTGTGTAAGTSEINVKQGSASIVNGGSYDFGSIYQSVSTTAVTFTIENLGAGNLNLSGSPKVAVSGTNSGDFVVNETSTSTPVIASGTTTFTIIFTPSATGVRSATLTIANNDADEGSYTVSLSGTGTASSVPDIDIQLGATSVGILYSFGNITQSTPSSTMTFTIANVGSGNLNLSGSPKITLGGTNPGDFSLDQTSTSTSITPSGGTNFTLIFTPSALGFRSATLTIPSNDPDEASFILYVNGTGIAAAAPEIEVKYSGTNIASAGTYNFGSVNLSSSSTTITFTIENAGSAALNLTGSPDRVYALDSQFSVDYTATTATVAASGSTTFTLTYNPTVSGTINTTLQIPSNDADEPFYWFFLKGTGVP
ncbi:MAG: choice-of-anchor D domain-containing protein [Spirochaetota bacterium]